MGETGFGVIGVGTWGELLADPEVRAVSVVLPDFLHREAAVAAAKAGKPESIRHFVRCAIENRAPLMDGRDGLAVTRLILKMEESARLRQPVAVGPLFEAA